MGILSRLGDIIESSINEVFDVKENPEKTARHIVVDMKMEFNKAVWNYNRIKARADLAGKNYRDALKISQSLEKKAETALSQDNHELADMLLARKIRADKNVSAYRKMHEEASTQAELIWEQVEELKIKIDKAENRQAILSARSKMADINKNVSEITSGLDSLSDTEKTDSTEKGAESPASETDVSED